jgi:hypothetical protein
MAILLDETLRFWLELELDDVGRPDNFRKRQQLMLKILRQWEEFGDTKKIIDSGGKERWWASQQLLQRLKEEEMEAREGYDDEDDDV